MKSYFICVKCKKRVIPKNRTLNCCGISETVNKSLNANSDYNKSVKIINNDLDKILFDPVQSYWNEDEDQFCDYEGIPNL
jgi:hypothetical protein